MGIWDRRANVAPRTHQYQWKLDETARVQLDTNGSGTVQLSPGGAREKWTINFLAVNVTNAPPNSILVPTMIMYRSCAVPGNQLGGTFAATMDSDSADTYILNMNEPIVFVFTGGDPGSVGNIHIEGIRYVWE